MRKLLALLLVMLLPAAVLAEELHSTPEGWTYAGYTHGGVTFMIPEDTQIWPLYPEEKAAGVVLVGGNADYTIQLRQFRPEVLAFDDFCTMILQEPTAAAELTEVDGVKILRYRNTTANENSELYGIALPGLDGCMYKISIFTGEDGAYGADAKVWQIAETIADSVHQMDFSAWPFDIH